jgi:Resolvase, N terminal domain
MSTVGYARVSTDHQSVLAQRDALTAAGCERIFTDQMSGVREDRPGLTKLLDYVRAGDSVVVVALDRLGRSLSGVIRTIETLTERGVLLRARCGRGLACLAQSSRAGGTRRPAALTARSPAHPPSGGLPGSLRAAIAARASVSDPPPAGVKCSPQRCDELQGCGP